MSAVQSTSAVRLPPRDFADKVRYVFRLFLLELVGVNNRNGRLYAYGVSVNGFQSLLRHRVRRLSCCYVRWFCRRAPKTTVVLKSVLPARVVAVRVWVVAIMSACPWCVRRRDKYVPVGFRSVEFGFRAKRWCDQSLWQAVGRTTNRRVQLTCGQNPG